MLHEEHREEGEENEAAAVGEKHGHAQRVHEEAGDYGRERLRGHAGGVIEAGSWTIDTNQQINLTSTAYIMLNGGELRMSNWGVSRDLEFNMAAGSVLSAKNIWIGDRTKLNISGSVTTTDGTLYIYQSSQSLDSTRLVVNQGATFDLKDSLNIAQATVEVAAGVAAESLIIRSGSIRLDNNHATLILRSSNTFKKTDNGSHRLYDVKPLY